MVLLAYRISTLTHIFSGGGYAEKFLLLNSGDRLTKISCLETTVVGVVVQSGKYYVVEIGWAMIMDRHVTADKQLHSPAQMCNVEMGQSR